MIVCVASAGRRKEGLGVDSDRARASVSSVSPTLVEILRGRVFWGERRRFGQRLCVAMPGWVDGEGSQ